MPPVRERADDVLLLAQGFLSAIAADEGRETVQLSDAAAEALKHYSWPGNVRQLENAMRQLVLLGSADEIDEASVYRMISGTEVAVDTDGLSVDAALTAGGDMDGKIEPLWITEKKAIEAAIAASDGSVNRAAKALQVAPSTIYRKIQSWKSPTRME